MGIADEIYRGGGAKPVSWTNVGEVVEGTIDTIRSKQLPKFGTEVPETWPDGSPKMTPIITVQTGKFDVDDDGRRDLYLRGNAHTAFGTALREAYSAAPSDADLVGATLKMQFDRTEPSGRGQPRKLFRAKITPKSTAGDAWGGEPPSPPPTDDDIPF